MARKKKPAEAVNTMEWINTYADTVTLLMCFFVLLFSFSTINEKKWKDIVDSLKGDYPITTEAKGSPVNMEGAAGAASTASTEKMEDALYKKIKNYIEEKDLTSKVELTKGDDMVTIRFKDTILFDPDKTFLRDDGKVILGDICDALTSSIGLVEMINIEGHTASNPKGLPEFQNTFEFSTQRAVNVLEYLITVKNIEPLKLSAIGYGQYHPLDTNETAEGRSRNRRVEIIVTSKTTKAA